MASSGKLTTPRSYRKVKGGEGAASAIKDYIPPARKAILKDSLTKYSSTVGTTSIAKYIPPKPTDKYGFERTAKHLRKPGEAFIGADDPGWLKSIYQDYDHYAKITAQKKEEKRLATLQRARNLKRRDKQLKLLGKQRKAREAKEKKKKMKSDDYLYHSISRREFAKLQKMNVFPYRSCNGRNLLGTMPPKDLKYAEPLDTSQERHIIGVQNTPAANKVAKKAQMGDLDAVKQLILSETASIHSMSRVGESLLHIAGTHGHASMVSWLLVQGADRGMLNAEGLTAYEATQRVVEKQGDKYHPKRLAWKECEALLSPQSMFAAAKAGNIRRMKWLMDNGLATVHSRNPYGSTALHIAALANQREAIEFLTEHGADPHAKNPLGQDAFDMTPLLALHALMNRKKKAFDLQQMKEHAKRAKETKEYDDKIRSLKFKKEAVRGTTAAKEIFSKYNMYLAARKKGIHAMRKLPKPDITYANSNRYAYHFLGKGGRAEDADPNFHLRVWPSADHAKFRHWFRSQFG